MSQFDYVKYGSRIHSVPKLYAGQGAKTDGAMTQKAATELLFAKADKTALPVKVSDLRNDADYQTKTQVQTLIDDAVAGISGIEYQVVTELPTTGQKGIIYLVETSATAGDIYDEFIWVDGDPAGHYEKIGTTAVDLSDYYTKTEVDAELALKADKEELPTEVSELENDAGYQTAMQVQALIDEALEGGGASGYTQVESITTSDGAWIDTGVAGSGLQKIRVRAAVPANKILNVVNYISQSSRMGFMIFNTSSHKMAFFWGGVGFKEQVIDANIDLSQPFDVYQDRLGITISQGSYSTTVSYSGSEDGALASGTLQLLHSGNPSHQTDQYNSGTIFSASIGTEGSDEWTTFEPAIRDEDSTAGLLETAPTGEQTFKTTAAAGTTFTAGAETETGYASKAWVKQYLETLDATGVSY